MKLRLLLSFPRSYFFPLTSGILLSLTLVYIGLSPLAWIALIPFLFFSTDPNISYWKLLKGTLLMGAIYYFFVTYPLLHLSGWWWTGSSGPSAMMFAHIKYSFIVLATALWSALWYLPSAFFIRKVGLRSPYVFVIAPVWAVVEYIRAGYGLDGYSWGALGYALTDTEYLKYIARLPLGGVYALSTLVVLGNLALVDVFSQILQTKESFFLRIRNTFREFIKNPLTHLIFWIFSLLLVASFIFGMVHTRTAESAGIPLRVAVVSSPLNTAESASESGYRYYRKKLNVAFSNNAQLIVLPENAFPYFELDEQSGLLSLHNRIQLTDRDLLYADLLALSVTHPDSVIAAGLHTQRDDKKYNSTVFLSRGSPIAFYHKRTLIPFTEYSPFGLDIPVAEPLTAGKKEQNISLFGIQIGVLMCSEVADTLLPMDSAELILSPANDSVFAGDSAGLVHAQMANMRAIEHGVYLLRANKRGISGVIDTSGRTHESPSTNVMIEDIVVNKN